MPKSSSCRHTALGDLHCLAAAVVQHGVKVVDLSQAVAAQGQRVGQGADARLSDVEGVLAVVLFGGVAVGHHQLGQRGPVDDGTGPALILIADTVEHESLAAGVANPETPLLPRHQVTINAEAGALGLHHVQRLQVGAELLDELLGVIAVIGRHRNDPVVLHSQHPHFVQVNDGYNTLDGAGVPVVVGAGLEPAAGEGEAQSLLLGHAVVARGPRVHHYQARIVDAPFSQRLLELGRGLDGTLALEELVHHQAGLNAGDVYPRLESASRQGHDCLVCGAGGVVEQDDERLPGGWLVTVPAQDAFLRWLL